jgi:hypothetical protein
MDVNRTLFWMFFTKRQPKIQKTMSAHTKRIDLILGPSKNNSSCNTMPLEICVLGVCASKLAYLVQMPANNHVENQQNGSHTSDDILK